MVGSWGAPGPSLQPRNAGDRTRLARRDLSSLPQGRPVLARTSSNRQFLLSALNAWLLETADLSLAALLQSPLNVERIVDLLVQYGRDLYGSGRPYWHYSETVNSVTSLRPTLRRQVQGAWDLSFAWLAEEPYSHHTALPAQVLLALLAVCLLWGWVREASAFALAWGALLRMGEVLQSTRSCLILPFDVLFSQPFILLKILEPKTRQRAARHQAAKLEASDLVELVDLGFRKLTPAERLWPGSSQALRRRMDLALKRLGIVSKKMQERPLDLGSFRPGGATYLLQATEDSELVRRRGRWVSHKVMEIYLQEVAASTFLPALPLHVRERVLRLAAGFPAILQQVKEWNAAGVPAQSWPLLFKFG